MKIGYVLYILATAAKITNGVLLGCTVRIRTFLIK
nr:MAG TPA: hypothetical protein [Caudoviricetes sp.]